MNKATKNDIERFERVYKREAPEDLRVTPDGGFISGNAQVIDEARIIGDAWVHGNAVVHSYAQVFGNAQVRADAQVQVRTARAKIRGQCEFGRIGIAEKRRDRRMNEIIKKGEINEKNKYIFRCRRHAERQQQGLPSSRQRRSRT